MAKKWRPFGMLSTAFVSAAVLVAVFGSVAHAPAASAGAGVLAAATPTSVETGAPSAPTPSLAPPAGMRGGSVLFVGNSFTEGFEEPARSFNRASVIDKTDAATGGIAGIFKRLTDDAGMSFTVGVSAVGGTTLGWHASKRPADMSGRWDAVVAQDFSTLPLPREHGGNPAAFVDGARAVRDLVRAGNPEARAYLYQTWASPRGVGAQSYAAGVAGLREMQTDLSASYARAGAQLRVDGVARVGDAFLRAVDDGLVDPTPADGIDKGKVSLWSSRDAHHAGVLGSYLAAAVLFATVTSSDARTLPTGSGSAAADLGITPDQARALHAVAASVAQSARARGA